MKFDNLSQSTIKSLSAKIWHNIITAGNAKNYGKFAKDFSAEMHKIATREVIELQWQQDPLLTKLLPDPEFIGYLKHSRGVRVLWKQKMQGTNDEALGHLELIYEDGAVKVDGAQIF